MSKQQTPIGCPLLALIRETIIEKAIVPLAKADEIAAAVVARLDGGEYDWIDTQQFTFPLSKPSMMRRDCQLIARKWLSDSEADQDEAAALFLAKITEDASISGVMAIVLAELGRRDALLPLIEAAKGGL